MKTIRNKYFFFLYFNIELVKKRLYIDGQVADYFF